MIDSQQFHAARQTAIELSQLLIQRRQKIVFAESCTAGLVSAIVAQIPGISAWLCGSAVTYRESVKESWLQIDPELIRTNSAVSPQVTAAMARNVLDRTAEAEVATAITGHVELEAADQHPYVFVACAFRNDTIVNVEKPVRQELEGETRVDRQWEAAQFAVEHTIQQIRQSTADSA